MNREELEAMIANTYSAEAEHPWLSYPEYAVFRHSSNQKWFAIVMQIPKEKLGLREEGMIEILDVKCDPILIGSLLSEPGFYPAYHMNKSNWITIALDGTVSDEQIGWLMNMSYDLTSPRRKRSKT